MTSFTRPRAISSKDDTSAFTCGDTSLDSWLHKRALANELERASRTYVTLAIEANQIAGYYALAAGSVANGDMPRNIRRNMPSPIPVVVLARLAVATQYQGQGLGSSLMQDAVGRAAAAGNQIGIRAMIIHALNPQAAAFYEGLGFTKALPGKLTYVAAMADIIKTLVNE